MTDPLELAAAKAPPVIGSGCTQRYDPEALSPEQGAEFADAAALWAELQAEQGNAGRQSSASTADESASSGARESTTRRRVDEGCNRSSGTRR